MSKSEPIVASLDSCALRALRLAETRAGVVHRPYRGVHGFRRAVAGDVARSTGNLKLAMEYIGDTEVRGPRGAKTTGGEARQASLPLSGASFLRRAQYP